MAGSMTTPRKLSSPLPPRKFSFVKIRKVSPFLPLICSLCLERGIFYVMLIPSNGSFGPEKSPVMILRPERPALEESLALISLSRIFTYAGSPPGSTLMNRSRISNVDETYRNVLESAENAIDTINQALYHQARDCNVPPICMGCVPAAPRPCSDGDTWTCAPLSASDLDSIPSRANLQEKEMEQAMGQARSVDRSMIVRKEAEIDDLKRILASKEKALDSLREASAGARAWAPLVTHRV